MAASSTSSWLHTSLLSPSAQQQTAQHALYPADLPLHHSSHVPHHQHVELGDEGHHSFCQPHQCPLNLEFHHAAGSPQLREHSRPSGGSCSGHVGTGGDSGGHVSARKVHKADREKLRRDRLNEQFTELAGVLDPDRPKNDKATILGDSVQVVKELRSEVKRLRTEQTSLLDESRDLAQEKTELREEKAALKSETEHLQGQLQQRLRLMLPWMTMDPSMLMGAAPYAYPMPVPQAVSAPPTAELNQPVNPGSLTQAVSTPPAYIPLAPTAPPGAYPLHPALQAYTMYANRPGDVSTPYLPYPHYPSQVSSHSHVERPFPQYPSPLQPLPGYLMHMHPHQSQPTLSGAPPVPSLYQPFGPGMPAVGPRTQGAQPNGQSRGATAHPNVPSAQYGEPGLQPYLDNSAPVCSVQTTLQLQMPLHPEPQKPSKVTPIDATNESPRSQSGVTGCSASSLSKENQPSLQETPAHGVGESTAQSPSDPALAGLCSPGASSTANGRNIISQQGQDILDPQEQGQRESDEATLRQPAA